MEKHFKELKQEFREMRTALERELRKEIRDVKTSLDFFNKQFEEISALCSRLEKENGYTSRHEPACQLCLSHRRDTRHNLSWPREATGGTSVPAVLRRHRRGGVPKVQHTGAAADYTTNRTRWALWQRLSRVQLESVPFLEDCGGKKPGEENRTRLLRMPIHLRRIAVSTDAEYGYVARYPCDVCYFQQVINQKILFFPMQATFDQLVDMFLEGAFTNGSYFEHVPAGCAQRNEPNVFFTTYKNMMLDIATKVLELAEFLVGSTQVMLGFLRRQLLIVGIVAFALLAVGQTKASEEPIPTGETEERCGIVSFLWDMLRNGAGKFMEGGQSSPSGTETEGVE
ncbi:hypothetical protein MRX96_056090 [Rhipicephalus microplus]